MHPAPPVTAASPLVLVPAGLLAAGLLMAGACYGLPLLVRFLQAARWRKKAADFLALTYDDGPDSVTTPALLDVLAELQVPATLYLVGFRAEANPAALERTAASGHELGTHTHSHKNAWKKGPLFELRDARRGYKTLHGAVPSDAPYRPPFGKAGLPTVLAMWAGGRRVDWWTAPANDTTDNLPHAADRARELLDTGGPVILMHCHHAEPNRRAFVLALTRELVRQGRERGRRFVTVGQLRESVQ